MPGPLVVELEGVELRWSGGRLADVYMPTATNPTPHAIHCLDVLDGEETGEPTREHLEAVLADFLREDYGAFYENA